MLFYSELIHFSVMGKGIFLSVGNIFRSVGWKCRTASARIMRHPHVNGVPVSGVLHATGQNFACYMAEFSVIPIRESCNTYYRKL